MTPPLWQVENVEGGVQLSFSDGSMTFEVTLPAGECIEFANELLEAALEEKDRARKADG